MENPCTLPLEGKLDHLKRVLSTTGPTLIAFSGGVDSSFLLATAAQVLGDQVVALMTISPSTPPEDAQFARSLTGTLGVRFLTVQHNELAIPGYAANPINRCYFCKNSLYEICRREARRLSLRSVADGVNLDDLKDYRPGLRAADEYGILHPLVEAQFGKEDIRQASRLLCLPTWEKPSSPCLASRVPYGMPITAAKLSQIARGELLLRSFGVKELRVRHHGRSARIEIALADLPRVSDPAVIQALCGGMRAIGFSSVLLDLEGYRGGVFNPSAIPPGEKGTARRSAPLT
ncbi:MAG: ATP-dependent sacrificial sulfur transferase LarE [Thermodesulfobacteriota bacterium]|jgi:uncharacterized protein